MATFTGESAGNTLTGGAENDLLQGAAGDDTLTGGAGDDILSGGAGNDVAVFAGSYADYSLVNIEGVLTVTGPQGTDQVDVSVEALQFDDAWVNPLRDPTPGQIGAEFRVNTYTPSNQYNPAITALADGGFVVTWISTSRNGSSFISDFYAQRYSSAGVAIGAEFRVNTYTGSLGSESAITALADGGFVVTWESSGQDGSGLGIYAQRYAATGEKVGAEFRINTYTLGNQSNPVITALADGGFVVTWTDADKDGSSQGIFGQRYAATGEKFGAEFQVNTYTRGNQTMSALTALTDGGFLVTWTSWYHEEENQISVYYGQRYAATGEPVGPEFRFNTYGINTQGEHAITVLSDGGFVVTWSLYHQDIGKTDIYGQCYAVTGEPVGVEFQINTYTNDAQGSPALTALADGGFVVTWVSQHQDGYYGWGIFGQRYSNEGEPVGEEFQVNTYARDGQESPAITALADGGFVVTWASSGPPDGNDRSGYGIYAQRYSSEGKVVAAAVTGDGSNQTLVGLAGHDTLNGEGGNDWLEGGDGNDLLDGGDGADAVINLDSGEATGIAIARDEVIEVAISAAGVAADTPWNINQQQDGGAQDDVLLGEAGDDNLIGRAGHDSLAGGEGADILEGGPGNDELDGGAGTDAASYADKVAGEDVVVTLNGATLVTASVGSTAEDALRNLEDLTGGAGKDTFIGDGLANCLSGGDGDDTLSGAGGNDLLQSGAGKDVLDGGAGIDTASFADKIVGEEVVVALNGAMVVTVRVAGAPQDSLQNIENLDGGAGNDTFTGDGLANRLSGGDRHDMLSGAGGNDILQGGAGNDVLNGGAGFDIASYADKVAGEDVVVTLNGATLVTARTGGNAEDTLKNIEHLVGGGGNDTFVGDGLANTLSGGEGHDWLQGKSGKDVLDGGVGVDTASFAEKTGGVVITLNSSTLVTATVAGVVEDTLRNVENVLGGTAADRLTGDGLDNLLNGSTGNDTLTSNGGLDTLIGGGGADLLRGGSGNDVIYGNGGNDALEGGDGADWLVFDTALNARSNVDKVSGFATGVDKLVLDDDIFTRFTGAARGAPIAASNYRVGTAALDGDDYLIYNTGIDGLFYDADGSGAGAAIRIATIVLTGTSAPAARDFLVIE
jgi:Ca2+-binding RTX toxin-like protein